MSLNVPFTTNQVCMKPYTHIYVSQTCKDYANICIIGNVNFWEFNIAFPNGVKWAPISKVWPLAQTSSYASVQHDPRKLARHVQLVKPTGKRPRAQRSSKAEVEWLHLRPCLVSSWCGTSRSIWHCCWPWRIPSPRAAVPATLPRGEAGMKMNEINNIHVI